MRRATAARHWLAGRTLRGRLIAGLVALLAIACAGVGVATYAALHAFLQGQLDSQLRTVGGSYAACIEHNGPPPPNPSGQSGGAEPPCSYGQATGTFGGRLKAGVFFPPHIVGGKCNLSAADEATLARLPADGRPYTLGLNSLQGDYRLAAFRGSDGDVLFTGLPLSDMETTLHEVELVEVAVFAAALLLAGLIGTGWVRLSLRPLRRVAATANRVTELPLASGAVTLPERVPDADPRTEVGQVGAAFNRMLGHVESALGRRAASEARLRRFAADASHELRTPLAAIRGYAEFARRHPGPVPEEVAHALSRVESESARMSVLVDDLLLLARLDSGRPLADEPVDLTRLAIDSASDARVASPRHRWLLELPDEPVMVRGDGSRLHQVLANLLSNAGRHTPPGTTVTVTLSEREEPHEVELSVTDDGPGIPAGLLPDLFERFVRGDTSRSRSAGSTGLGLAIVDAVVTAHGGTASVRSQPGRTRFVIRLPRTSS